MLQFLKPAPPAQPDMSLWLQAADGTALRSFDAEVVAGLRHMITQISYTSELPRRIALIAALRGEGVTYTSLALATTLANDLGRSIVVVELNWANPGLLAEISPAAAQPRHRRKRGEPELPRIAPELADRPGLADVLRGEVDLEAALYSTSLPNLHLLPAGGLAPEQQPSTARGPALRALINTLSEQFDHVLFDVPAILGSSDAIALASLAESCCVVVRHGVTPFTQVQEALDDVRHLTMLGVILNQVQVYTPGWIRALIPQQ